MKNCVTLFEPSSEQKEKANEAGLRLITYEELISIGKSVDETTLEEHESANLDSILVNCYTSGTTGMPKGVLAS